MSFNTSNQILLEILDEVQRRAQKWAFHRLTVSTTAGQPTEIHVPHAGDKKFIYIKASPKNTDYIYIAPVNSVATSGAQEGYPLEPNEVMEAAKFSDCQDTLYAIADTAQVIFAFEFIVLKKFSAKQKGVLNR